MARSQEKAMSMLNRWVDQRRSVESGAADSVRSSRFPTECRSSKDGEAARSQVVRQIGTLISQIQNASLGEQRIREVNDEINRLLRLKYAWEMQIRKLGGPDYSSMARLGEADGVEVPGQGGYRYFGAAKELPGVRELLEQPSSVESMKKSRKELMQNITAEYYGWLDETDLELLDEERKAEIHATAQLAGAKDSEGTLQFHQAADMDRLPRQNDRKHLQRLLLQIKKEHLIREYIRPQEERDSHTAPLESHDKSSFGRIE